MSNFKTKSGHPILAIILGVLGIVSSFILCLFGGIIGGAISGVLGLAALLIGLSSQKSGGRGRAGMIAGLVAIVFAVSMTVGTVNIFQKMRVDAQNNPETPTVARFLDNPEFGLLGIFFNLPKDQNDITFDDLEKELDILMKNATEKA